VTVGNSGFTLAGSAASCHPSQAARRRLRHVALTTKLTEVKNQFKDETKATFNADAGTAYENRDQDPGRYARGQGGHMLFPDIVFAAGIM